MTSTIPAVMDPTWWTAMSSCGPARLAATPTGGGWGWGCCSSAGSPPGCGAPGDRPDGRTAPARPSRRRPSPAAVEAELVGLLASMALAVAARG